MPRKTPTFHRFFLDTVRPMQVAKGRQSGTLSNYDSHFRAGWFDVFLDKPLHTITPMDVDLWWLSHDGKKLVGRRGAYVTLSMVLKYAAKYDMTYQPGRSPAQVENWSTDHSKKPLSYSYDDMQNVRSLMPKHLQGAVTLMFAATLRVGEISGLNLGDWNPETKELTVSRNYTNGRELKSTKSGKPKVLVPLQSGIDVIEAIRVPKTPAWGDFPMFTGEARGRLHPAVFRQCWARARRMAGKPAMRAYDVRHVSITAMAEAGLPLHIVAERAGHARVTTTQRYVHSVADRSAADAARIDQYLEGR